MFWQIGFILVSTDLAETRLLYETVLGPNNAETANDR